MKTAILRQLAIAAAFVFMIAPCAICEDAAKDDAPKPEAAKAPEVAKAVEAVKAGDAGATGDAGKTVAPPAMPGAIKLPPPQNDIGKPLMAALKARSSARAFSPEALPLQILSNLLWAADGINRPAAGKRTAPSAMNWQEVDIYVALPEGLYLYDAKFHVLNPIVGKDLRAATGKQDFVKDAPVNLLFVADTAKATGKIPDDEKLLFCAMDVGYISQNVYLFCASEGLATVARASVDKESLAKENIFKPTQRPLLAQSVGFPAKK